MKSAWTTLVIFCFLLLVSGCVGPREATSGEIVPERWNFTLDSNVWELGYKADDGKESLREYVPKGQTVSDWTELVSSGHFANPVSPNAAFGIMKLGLLADCPSAQISIIEEKNDSIIFEWRFVDCPGKPAQHEIRRISAGRYRTYTLSFVEKTRQLSPIERDKWISIIKAATIRPDS